MRFLKIAVASGVGAIAPAHAQGVADFYKGKTVHVLVGAAVGGDYDVQARLVSRHIAKHIPGEPSVVVENMVGAGGLTMVNYLANVAPKDGTYIGVIPNNFPALQWAGNPGIQFDAAKFGWLGGLTRETDTMASWHKSSVKTIEDAQRNEVIAGATGRGAVTYTFPAMLNALIGTKFKIITGYTGGSDINLAMERGEVAARLNSWSAWKNTKADWIRSRYLNVLIQAGRRHPELPDVPSLETMARNDEDRELIRVTMLGNELGRPFAIPPAVPAERLEALRAAFGKMAADPALLAEADNLKIELAPTSGPEMQALVESVFKAPKSLAGRAKEFLD